MNKVFFSAILVLGFSIGLLAQTPSSAEIKLKEVAEGITSQELKAHLSYLASDELEGRETGTPGNDKAAQYIADQFKSFGIPAVKQLGNYFQPVAFTWTSWEDISIKINDSNYRHLWDFVSFPAESSSLPLFETKKILFLGYGIDDEQYSDYDGQKVEGKVLLIYKGEPKDEEGNSYITKSSTPSEWAENWERKLQVAKEKGVKAVFFIEDQLQKKLSENRRFLVGPMLTMGKNEADQEKLANHAFISTTMAKEIMGKRFDKVVEARKNIQASGQPESVKLKAKLSIIQQKSVTTLTGNNVLAYIEGTDPKKKDELIVITAHYDHLGRRADAIYNGADDNGSGTSTNIEVAEAFAEAKKQGIGPKRSVLVMLVTGEEKGLLGSEYYVNNPIFPLENTVANINVDMVGRVDEKYEDNPNYIYVIGSDRLSTELHAINEEANEKYTNLVLDYTYNAEDDPNRYYYRSDHYNFAERGIPAIFYFNGTHEDYHRTTDTVEKINFEKMSQIGQLVFYTAWELANREKRIIVDVE